ncbi:MAG: phage tail tape measure protein, partial [Segatella copri]
NLKKRQQDVKTLQAQIDKLTGAVNKHGSAWSTAAKNLVAYVGLFGAFNMIKQKITDVINLNFKYSDSLANVRKVTNWSMKDVEELSNKLSKMDTRTSLEGLTQLAYVGSRMGMGKYGVQGLAEFAQASDRVNVALKEDLGDDAMLILSKFVETMGEVERHGGNISEAFDSVSSSIFKLASTSTANGGNILEFAKRLTGLSKSAHITSDQLLGLASASDSLMLMPEVASTAFGKLITSLWTNYHEIEKMLGMQEDSLKDMMSKGQTMQALVKVLENVSDKNLSSMDEYFKEFGSDGQRLKSVVVTMAQNIGVLKSHLKESSEAYREGTAVTKEYEIQQQTAQAILERANNMWEKAFVNPNGIDAVKEMAKVWYNFSKELTQSKPFLTSVRILFWELKKSVEALLFVLPGLLAYLGTRGLVMAFTKLIPLMIGIKGSGIVSFFTLLTQAVRGSHFATLRLIVSWRQLSLAMKTNIIGLAISVVTSLGIAIYDLVKKTDTASSSVQKFNR